MIEREKEEKRRKKKDPLVTCRECETNWKQLPSNRILFHCCFSVLSFFFSFFVCCFTCFSSFFIVSAQKMLLFFVFLIFNFFFFSSMHSAWLLHQLNWKLLQDVRKLSAYIFCGTGDRNDAKRKTNSTGEHISKLQIEEFPMKMKYEYKQKTHIESWETKEIFFFFFFLLIRCFWNWNCMISLICPLWRKRNKNNNNNDSSKIIND